MDTVQELLKQCPNVKEFDSKTKLLGIIRRHGYYIMNEEEYQNIIQAIKAEEDQKRKLDTDSLKKVTVGSKELVTYTDKETGEQITVDNSVSNRDVKEQMQDIQNEHQQFQSLKDNNSLNVMEYMRDKVKITPNTVASNDINMDAVNEEERQIAIVAKAFENQLGHHVDIDLNDKIIYDNGIVYTIEKRNGEYGVFLQDEVKAKKEEKNKRHFFKAAAAAILRG